MWDYTDLPVTTSARAHPHTEAALGSDCCCVAAAHSLLLNWYDTWLGLDRPLQITRVNISEAGWLLVPFKRLKCSIPALQHHLDWSGFWSDSLSTSNVNLIPPTAFQNHWQQDARSGREIDFPEDWFYPGSRADLQRKRQWWHTLRSHSFYTLWLGFSPDGTGPVINLVFPSISLPAAGSRRGEATPSKMLFQLVSVWSHSELGCRSRCLWFMACGVAQDMESHFPRQDVSPPLKPQL